MLFSAIRPSILIRRFPMATNMQLQKRFSSSTSKKKTNFRLVLIGAPVRTMPLWEILQGVYWPIFAVFFFFFFFRFLSAPRVQEKEHSRATSKETLASKQCPLVIYYEKLHLSRHPLATK
jgi:hypothetical protein